MEHGCPYLLTFLSILSSSFLIPFRILKKPKLVTHVRVTSRFRKIASTTVNVLALIFHLTWVMFAIPTSTTKKYDILLVYYAAAFISSFAAWLTMQYLFWMNPEALHRILDMTSIISLDRAVSKKQKWNTIIFCTFIWILTISHVGCKILYKEDYEQFYHFVQAMCRLLCETFPSCSGLLLECQLSKQIIYLIFMFSFFTATFIFNLINVFMIVIALTFRNITENYFIPRIQRSYGNAEALLEEYMSAKEVASKTSSVFGTFILVYYICALTYIAEVPAYFLNTSVLSKITMCLHSGLEFIAFWFAAWSHSRIEQCLRNSVMQCQCERGARYSANDRIQLLSLLYDMDKEPLGLSCCFFTLTKSFLASSFSLVISYSVIAYQMRERI